MKKSFFYASILVLALLSQSLLAQSLAPSSRGNSFNPAIGLNALSLFKNSSRGSHDDGFELQEVELQLSSDVDAYFRAEARLALHPEEDDGAGHTHSFAFEPEEVFVETISIPRVTIRAGKFYANFGKYNIIHTHALPFIYRSQLQLAMFGDEGLSENGIRASFLAPLPWFSDVTIHAMQPTNEEVFTDSHRTLAYLLKWTNLWDLSDSLTFELGTSALTHSAHDHESEIEDKTSMYGADFTFKWRPLKNGNSASLMWSTEFIHKDRSGTNNLKNSGYNTFVRYQLSRRWFTQLQYEHLGLGQNLGKDLNAYTGLVAFVPTEFSAIRLQYDSIHDGEDKPNKRMMLQLNISIGAHPAHMY